MKTVPMPVGGIYRAGRWEDVESFPEPAPEIPIAELASPLTDGPRWEDIGGGFATAKCSRTAEAAIGRTIARYRPRVIPAPPVTPGQKNDPSLYGGIINVVKNYLDFEPDFENEPDLVDGLVPPDIFDDLYVLHLPTELGLSFVDLEDAETRAEAQNLLGDVFKLLGLSIEGNNLARERDRRLTRLVLRALYDLSSGSGTAGIRIPGQPDEHWEAFVLWSPPTHVDLAADNDEFRWAAPWDDDVMKAVASLGLQLPMQEVVP